MNTEDIKNRLTQDFDIESYRKSQLVVVKNASSEAVDIYQRDANKIRENAKKDFPKGSSHIVNTAVLMVIDGTGGEGLAHAYKEAREDDSELRRKGERDRAELVRKQYMNEYFLPAVELVVNSASPDELLNNKSALDMLDQFVLSEGSGKGYTASYVRQAYDKLLGRVEGRSDDYVRSEMRKLHRMMDHGEIRSAYGIARKLRDKIDSGQAMADEFDWNTIGKILSYYG